MAYLIDNPPRRSQYRSPRRSRPTGCIVLHSAENVPDLNPPDTGAENVARFIRDRTDVGSYHDLCDSDSTVHLVRYSDEAYQDGTGSNPWALSVSGAFRANEFRNLPLWWRNGCIDQMARAARRQADWMRTTHGIHVPARRITRAQSQAGHAGFISHAERDPARRSDPGPWFPWDQFLAIFTALDTIDPLEDDDMLMVRHPTGATVLLAGGRLGGIKAAADARALTAAGVPLVDVTDATWQEWHAKFGAKS